VIFSGLTKKRKWDFIGLSGMMFAIQSEEGGLGIRPHLDMNKALKVKLLWRFAKEDNTLGKNLVKMKYDVDRFGWWSKKSPHPHGVGC